MSRYLDATNDVAFKRVFSNKDRLKDFLNAIMRLQPGERIKELTFIPNEEIPDLGQGKRSIFDLKCRTESGKIFIVEMQNRREKHFLQRMQFYASHAHSSQLKLGDSYADILPVVAVAISKHKLLPDHIDCISYHNTREEKTNEQHLFALSYIFIELAKFTKKPEELLDDKDYWLYFLSTSEKTREPPNTIDDAMVLDAYKTLEQLNWDELGYGRIY